MAFELQNDFFDQPGILGRFIPDSSLCAVFNISAVIAASVYLSPLAGVVALGFAIKDVGYNYKKDKEETDRLINKVLEGSEQPKALIGSDTKLHAIPVEGVEVADTQIVDLATGQIDLLNLPQLIVDNMYSYAVIAPSGGGKGMLVSNVTREYKRRNPGKKVILIDPKDDPKERKYWEGVVDVWHRGNFRKMEIEEKSDWLNEALDIIRDVEEPHLAIMDEATMTFSFAKNCDRKLFNRLVDYVTSTASGGNSAEEFLFLMGHSGNLGDYGISGGQMSSFRKIYIAPNTNLEAIAQLGSTNFCGDKFGADKLQEITAIADSSPVNRAVYVGTRNAWFPMAELENFSGYNRDTQTFIDGQPEQVEETVEVSSSVDPAFVTPIQEPPVTVSEDFVKRLAVFLDHVLAKGGTLDMVTPDKITDLASKSGKSLSLDQARIAIMKAKEMIGV